MVLTSKERNKSIQKKNNKKGEKLEKIIIKRSKNGGNK